MAAERVTVTLPPEIVRAIDRVEPNRSRFILKAVREELARRRRYDLRLSLRNPHPETLELAEMGLQEWARGLPADDAKKLLDPGAGVAVRWEPGRGWVEVPD